MSADSALPSSPGFPGVWKDLANQGFALTTDQAIGLSETFREYFTQRYFVEGTIRYDEGDRPRDRQRARDVIHYQWRGDDLKLEEYGDISLIDRAGIEGKRIHARVHLMEDPLAEKFIRTFLQLVPEDRRQREGTFGINLFRTFTDIVSMPHKDHEEFIVLYVLDRVGGGAETYLYETGPASADSKQPAIAHGDTTAEPVFSRQLDPGDLIIFEDGRFNHGATPLEDPPGGKAMRDVLVCTVDYEDTYLLRTP